jgi:methionine--tRNA ligase beta chain
MITVDDFKKIEIRVGKILSAEKVEGSEKLVRLEVDLGETAARQIIAGIAPYFSEPSVLVGKKFAFAANLEPRFIKGMESQGMILAAGDEDSFSLLSVDDSVPCGSLIR